ncbi:ABC transporter substrate-binding protein [Cohnella sp. CIP 111063]|uniref:ABC transporter substrate-binding protein n=1 Tax=unclassified Cohnella TaxID=2636738 RepID=UPI000B8C0D58|nr:MULTISPECIES: ABC transporter substrate-binding protein [unclassified Cohnella]OXS59263.1 ABC transporter substrate-binding protein [Cohnella sp. CIP 111063]PRX72279.1 peptide/nickel transport system substrate-binding protein [Cohnella sp. SGD-V74]
MSNKRKIVRSLPVLALIFAIALAGCAQKPSSGESSAAGGASPAAAVSSASPSAESGNTPQGGELSYALATSPDQLDPHRSGYAVAVRVIRTIHDSLVAQAPDGSIHPWLATEWEASPDGKSYTFKLRQDVKFHDGTPFNAEAVKYNYDRILNPETKAANSQSLIYPYESAEVLDEYTVKLNLKTPSSAFLGNLSQALVSIVSPTAAEKYGDQLTKNPVGSGPFKFVSWEENSQIVVERNPDYNWGPDSLVDNTGAPYLDKIAFKIVPEEATRIGSVQSGQILAGETVPPQNIASLANDAKLQIFKSNTQGLPFTLFINQKREPWGDTKLRQALQAAIDVGSIVKTLYLGTYDQAWSPLTPGTLGYDASLENANKFDQNKANALFDELGWLKGDDGIRAKDGKKLTLRYVDGSPNREKRNDIAAIVQQQLKQVGIAVEVEITQDFRTVIFEQGNYDIYGNSQVNSDPEALRNFYHSGAKSIAASQNLPGYANAEVDALLDAGLVEQDPAKREDIYKQIQQIIIRDAVIIPIYVFPYTVAASKTVEALKFDSLAYPLFNDVYLGK